MEYVLPFVLSAGGIGILCGAIFMIVKVRTMAKLAKATAMQMKQAVADASANSANMVIETVKGGIVIKLDDIVTSKLEPVIKPLVKAEQTNIETTRALLFVIDEMSQIISKGATVPRDRRESLQKALDNAYKTLDERKPLSLDLVVTIGEYTPVPNAMQSTKPRLVKK